MSLALTGAKGGERLAKRWAQQKGVRLVLAKPDFERFGRAAPFRANDQLMTLRPVCVLVLPDSLGPSGRSTAVRAGDEFSRAGPSTRGALRPHRRPPAGPAIGRRAGQLIGRVASLESRALGLGFQPDIKRRVIA